MEVQDAIGQAYKNGYEAGKKDAVVHGRWYEVQYIDKIACSVCGQHWSIIDNCTETFNYCPHCGAKMDGGKEDV